MTTRELETGTKLPSVEPLNRVILCWDFYNDVTDDRRACLDNENAILQKSIKAANSGGGRDSTQNPSEKSLKIQQLPTRFSSEDDYINRLYPLFLLETKQSIHRAKEMEMENPEIVVELGAESRDGFFILTLQRADNLSSVFFSSDLGLLYLDPPNEDNPNAPKLLDDPMTCTASDPSIPNVNHTMFAVETSIRNLLVVKVMIPSVSRDDDRAVTRITNIAKAINTSGQRWYMVRIMGTSTIHREYQALMSFPDSLLKDDLVLSGEDPIAECLKSLDQLEEQKKRLANQPVSTRRQHLKRIQAMEKKRLKRLSDLRHRAELETKETLEIPHQLTMKLKELYNDSQMAALKDCLKAQGVTLIQGPPGTGKTTTIVGVLSVILNASVKKEKKRKSNNELEEDSAPTTPSGRDLTDDSLSSAAKRRKLDSLRRSQPWIYDPVFTHWYDKVRVFSEDLEKYIYKEANETDCVLNLAQAEHDAQPRRVLVCAPSNAAIDEILKRLTADPENGGGVFDSQGERYNPAVVRVGPNVHPDLVAYSLESRVNTRLQAMGDAPSSARNSVKMNILAESRIVCSTLSICGSRDITAFPDVFDTVVVDEASQGVELSTLIPLRLGCRRLILVGDPKQLPATVFSRIAIQQNYDQSLFQRLEKAGHKVNLLSIQYRMHPSISAFPSAAFYDGNLLDAPHIRDFVKPPVPWFDIPIFRPVVFFSIESAESSENTSMINSEEAQFICQLVDLLGIMFAAIPGAENTWHSKIAVISPYAEQVRLIRKLLKLLLQVGTGKSCPIDVNTVDGFQGREKDLVIFSAVRAQYTETETSDSERLVNVGFLSDIRRMNVALTRARHNLWVVGNASYLRGNPEWGKFIAYTEKEEFQFNVNFKKVKKDGYLKRWLYQYVGRVPSARIILESHVPKFLEALERDVSLLVKNDKSEAQTDGDQLSNVAKNLSARINVPKHAAEIDDGDFDEDAVAERDAKLKPKEVSSTA